MLRISIGDLTLNALTIQLRNAFHPWDGGGRYGLRVGLMGLRGVEMTFQRRLNPGRVV